MKRGGAEEEGDKVEERKMEIEVDLYKKEPAELKKQKLGNLLKLG